jgi:hypothetical protein
MLLLVACIAGQYSTVGAQTFDRRTTELSDQIEGLQNQVAGLQAQLNQQAQGAFSAQGRCCIASA